MCKVKFSVCLISRSYDKDVAGHRGTAPHTFTSDIEWKSIDALTPLLPFSQDSLHRRLKVDMNTPLGYEFIPGLESDTCYRVHSQSVK